MKRQRLVELLNSHTYRLFCFTQTLLYKCTNRLNTHFTGSYLTGEFQLDLSETEHSPEPPLTPAALLSPLPLRSLLPTLPAALSLQLSADSRNYDLFPVRRNNRMQRRRGEPGTALWNSGEESSSTVVTLCVCLRMYSDPDVQTHLFISINFTR